MRLFGYIVILMFGLSVVMLGTARADMDNDRALAAVKEGKIKPVLSTIEKLERRFAGHVVDIDFEENDASTNDPVYIYRIQILTTEGRLINIVVDAATGDIIGLGGQGIE